MNIKASVTKRPWITEVHQDGFVLPVVVIALALMSVVAMTALVTADDERRSANAMRHSNWAFYAAESGLHDIWANWPKDQVDSLQSGDTLDLGWFQLEQSAGSYRVTIERIDDGGQKMYLMTAEGRGQGPLGAQRVLSLAFTEAPGVGYELGQCCNAAATVRGEVNLEGSANEIDGYDEHPAGWESAGVCADSLKDKAGLAMPDTDLLDNEGSTLDGVPPLKEDPSINDATFNDFGDLTWEQVKNMADHAIGDYDDSFELDDGDIGPTYNNDGTCDTSNPYNWGSSDPDDACFDHFPIILIRGEVQTVDIYGQGIIIVDWDDNTGLGGEFELEANSTFNGVILGRGCVDIQDGANFHGSVFVDGKWYNDELCSNDGALIMEAGGEARYSQCAVDRAMYYSGLGEHGDVEVGGLGPIPSRAFTEVLR